jgi:hypothetical protein
MCRRFTRLLNFVRRCWRKSCRANSPTLRPVPVDQDRDIQRWPRLFCRIQGVHHRPHLAQLPKLSQSVADVSTLYSPAEFRQTLLEKIAAPTLRPVPVDQDRDIQRWPRLFCRIQGVHHRPTCIVVFQVAETVTIRCGCVDALLAC